MAGVSKEVGNLTFEDMQGSWDIQWSESVMRVIRGRRDRLESSCFSAAWLILLVQGWCHFNQLEWYCKTRTDSRPKLCMVIT
jgi:hypothetical protein